MALDGFMTRTLILLMATISFATAEFLPLWPGEAPGAKVPPKGTEKMGEGGRLSDIEVPQYQVYLPEKAKATGGRW